MNETSSSPELQLVDVIAHHVRLTVATECEAQREGTPCIQLQKNMSGENPVPVVTNCTADRLEPFFGNISLQVFLRLIDCAVVVLFVNR